MRSINSDQSLVIYECCRVVKGYTKSIIYDLQRSTNRFIPNDLANLLLENNGKKTKEIFALYPKEQHDILLENISLLISEEYIFLTKFPERFPSLPLQWDEPSRISNAILEYGDWMKSDHVSRIFDQLLSLGCRHVEFRVYNKITVQELFDCIEAMLKVGFMSLDVFANCPSEFDLAQIKSFVCGKINLHKLTLFNCENSDTLMLGKEGFGTLTLTPKSIDGRIHCGNVSRLNFAVNIKLYTESLAYGNCLNRKLSIDMGGQIKNCPSMTNSYGHIETTYIEDVINLPSFKEYWDVSKDKIHICKDCEFRYMCHDCRAYVEDPEDIFSKPLKCGYNPYTGEWSEWSTNPLKQKAIDFYGMREMVEENKV